MNRDTLERMPMDKTVDLVIVGAPLPRDLAIEIIRRTDSIFFMSERFVSAYGRNVRRMLGYPQVGARARGTPQASHGDWNHADWEQDEAAKRFRARWGFIELHWLANAQVLRADGWCHPDGAIYLAERSGRFPLASDYYDDCLALARAFPALDMDVAVWGGWNMLPGTEVHRAPPSPWSIEVRDRIQWPSFGVLVRSGEVRVVDGRDSALFADRGMDFRCAAEVALDQWRRRKAGGRAETAFGDREHHRGIDDDVVRSWIDTSRALGIVRPDTADGSGSGSG